MLDLCRDPLRKDWLTQLDAIKVTGSNGKGSVSAMVSSILDAAGVTVGLYTSPHVFDFSERIVVAEQPISGADLDRSFQWLERELERYGREHPEDRVAAFEAATALAIHHFARCRPEAAVVEAGIGGRYDSTRVFPGRLTALVSLDLEHTALLGATLEEIAYDKADLAASGSTLVVGSVDPEVLRRLRAYAQLRQLDVVVAADVCRLRRHEATDSGTRLDIEIDGRRWHGLELALLGSHQVLNAQVAVALARRWLERHRRMSAQEIERAARQGLAEVRWPCRLEKVRTDPDVFVDAGHTPGAISALVSSVREIFGGRRILLVTGVSQDKEARAIVSRLTGVADEVVATRAHHKGRDVGDVASIVRQEAPELPLTVDPSIEDALTGALKRASRAGMVVLVAGGLFLAAEAAAMLRGRSPLELRFL